MSDSLRVRAVIFDVDGTLVDSLAAYRVVAERAAAPYGLTISDAVVRDALNTTRPFWDLALPPDFADRAETMEKLRREAARLWPEVLRDHGRLCPDAERVLTGLHDRGAKLGIATASRRGSLEALQRVGLIDLFDAVVTREDVTRRKPDPEGLLTCASRLGIGPRDTAYVGDSATRHGGGARRRHGRHRPARRRRRRHAAVGGRRRSAGRVARHVSRRADGSLDDGSSVTFCSGYALAVDVAST
jgi:HAD superfamily hydrolase (TIGR01509 family)